MISNEQMNDLKATYRQVLMTPIGQRNLKLAVEEKRGWLRQKQLVPCSLETRNVKTKSVSRISKSRKLTKITITPIGLNNFCHWNANIFKDFGRPRLGFNVLSCRCGKSVSFELHTVNEKDGILYDFTRDFNDETEKYFLEVETNMCATDYVDFFGNEETIIQVKGIGCKCGMYAKTQMKQLEFQNRLEVMEKIKIHYQ
jgi:hypothetical protein